jgi:sugar/nucleoside kinase (ribokinase family)
MTNMALEIPTKDGRRWDLVALGEVMLRFDPGDARIHTARAFRVWEGGGEYNVARGLKRCFGFDTALVSALADNPVGRLVQDLIYQGGVDQSHVRWVKYDGVGREVRNGLNFVERGYGIRAAVGCSDRGHTAVSQLAPGDVDCWRSWGVRARAGCTPEASSARSRRRHRRSPATPCSKRGGAAPSCRSISTIANRCGAPSAATSVRSR